MKTETIIQQLRLYSDPERQEKSKTYFPTSMEVLGLKNQNVKDVIREIWPEIKGWDPDKLIAFTKELVATKIMECNHLAYELLWKNKKALDLLKLSDLEQLGANIDNWATTDGFSVMLSGWAWRKNNISDADVISWLESRSRWWRRAAVVSTVGLNLKSRGGVGDTKRTLMICKKVIDDRDDMIVKALSWALRELSKTDKPAVEGFLKYYRSRLAGRVVREVTSKLETGLKNG